MKEHMQYIIDHADEIEKLLKVKAQVSEVKSIMLENIDKVSQIPFLTYTLLHIYCPFLHAFVIDWSWGLQWKDAGVKIIWIGLPFLWLGLRVKLVKVAFIAFPSLPCKSSRRYYITPMVHPLHCTHTRDSFVYRSSILFLCLPFYQSKPLESQEIWSTFIIKKGLRVLDK